MKLVIAGGTDGRTYKVTFNATTNDATPLVKKVEALFVIKET